MSSGGDAPSPLPGLRRDAGGAAELFSRQAAAYAAFRPTYPPELFTYLATVVRRRELAWDCATGNGQAAAALAEHFARVVATDVSPQQIAHAVTRPNVDYRVAPAEASGADAASVDLVTVAQALHWLDLQAFYAEAKRVLVPGGAIAVWGYGSAAIDDAAAHHVFNRFEYGTLGDYWPAGRDIVVSGYRGVAFPFAELSPPPFSLERRWTLAELAGYARSWSATARYVAARGGDPVAALERDLAAVWGDPTSTKHVAWPLALRVGTLRRSG